MSSLTALIGLKYGPVMQIRRDVPFPTRPNRHAISPVVRTAGLAMAFLCAFSIPAATIRDDAPDSGYLALGASSDYASVGTFVNSWGYTGCGILIAADWVLTAAHLFTAASSGTFTINGTAYTSSQLITDPNWNSANVLGGSDIGLIHLSTPVSDVTPAMLYTGASDFGAVGTFVGYGMTGTGLTGATMLDYQKRGFQNVIDGDFGNPALLLGADFDNPHSAADNQFGDATPLAFEGAVANGDSGGGVFITVGGQTYLVGVISAVVATATDGSANADYGDITAFGRVSAFADWIGSHVPSAVPEPAAPVVIALGGLMFLLLRPKARHG